MSTHKNADTSSMCRLCLVCGKPLPRSATTCCTAASVVATQKRGLFRKVEEFFSLNGSLLSPADLQEMRDKERERLRLEKTNADSAKARKAALEVRRQRLVGDSSGSMYRDDAGRSGSCAAVPLRSKPVLRWSHDFGERAVSTPVLTDSTVFVVLEQGGHIVAMDRNSGAIRWRHEIFSKQLTANDIAPAVSDDIVFLGVEGTMYALDAITGERIWTLNRNNSISSTSPVVQKGIVYFLDGGDFCAADMLTGKIRWTTEGVYIPLMPARLPNGNFVVPSDTGGVYTIAPGGAVSRSDVTGILSGAGNHPFPFSVGGDIAFTACLNRCTIAAIREMEDGIYSFESGFSIAPCDQLTVAGKRIYAAGYSGVVCCEVEWNEPTCRVRPLWEYSARESLAPVVAQDVVYCRDDRTIVALEASTGSLIWRYEGTGREYRPTAGNETVVLTTIEGCVKYLSTH